MAIGDVTAVCYGTFSLSGNAIVTALNTINLGALSGSNLPSELFIVGHGDGQASIIKTTRAAS